MKVKTSELIGPALTYAVILAEGHHAFLDDQGVPYYCHEQHGSLVYPDYTTQSDAGLIIEREGIEVKEGTPLYFPQGNENGDYYEPLWIVGKQHGQTAVIASMRFFVASRLGDEVHVHEELI